MSLGGRAVLFRWTYHSAILTVSNVNNSPNKRPVCQSHSLLSLSLAKTLKVLPSPSGTIFGVLYGQPLGDVSHKPGGRHDYFLPGP